MGQAAGAIGGILGPIVGQMQDNAKNYNLKQEETKWSPNEIKGKSSIDSPLSAMRENINTNEVKQSPLENPQDITSPEYRKSLQAKTIIKDPNMEYDYYNQNKLSSPLSLK
jgi:hypothetical protein